jgi:hypothetical protein
MREGRHLDHLESGRFLQGQQVLYWALRLAALLKKARLLKRRKLLSLSTVDVLLGPVS